MKPKWYIGILIIALTLLGSEASTRQAAIPNQEIVLQFTSETVSHIDTENAIAIVKQQLLSAGITDIQVQKHEDGQLKISYYSASDVASIKALLSEENNLKLGYESPENNQSNTPSEDHKIDYDLDVYEIHQANDISDLDGKLALETKAENDRLSNPNVFISPEIIDIDAKQLIDQVAYKFRKAVAIAIDNNSYKIPEVRAGPSKIGMFDFS